MPRTPPHRPLGNAEIAERLDEIGRLLEAQGANPFRARAYQKGAEVVRGLGRPLGELLASEGAEGLMELPGVGRSLARTIESLARTGRVGLLDRLRGAAARPDGFATVPGIGPELARRIHDLLGIETLPELEAAAHDGSLARVPGIGRERIRAVRESLAGRGRTRARAVELRAPRPDDPPVAELLDVDREYREASARGSLARIAPRRFNPTGEAWLPVLHTERAGRHYTALFSNTARAHELGTTHDWVVIYRDDAGGDGQWTVVTARLGALRGLRVVRGRERECRDHHGLARARRERSAGTS